MNDNSSQLSGVQIIDMGVNIPSAWSAGKKLIEMIMDEQGEVNFGEFYIKDYALPSIDIFYDDPKRIKIPLRKSIDGKDFCLHENTRLIYTEVDGMPGISEINKISIAFGNDENNLKLVATRPTSLVATIYGCSLTTSIIVDKLLRLGLDEEEIQWSWSTIIMPTLTDELKKSEERMKAAITYGTVTSIWVRTEDKKIQEILSHMDLCGELRIHNLLSAKTFIHGSLNIEELQSAYNINLGTNLKDGV